MNSLVVSYHVPESIKDFIETESKKVNLPKGKFLSYFIEDYKRIKDKNEQFKSYFDMAQDKDFLIDQITESEIDIHIELTHNNDLWSE